MLGEIEDADLAFAVGDIVDNFGSLSFTQDKAVLQSVVLLDQIDKGVDRKGIMLAGDGKFRLAVGIYAEMLLHDFRLLQKHPRKG